MPKRSYTDFSKTLPSSIDVLACEKSLKDKPQILWPMKDQDDQSSGDNFHLVEFRTLKDLFSFVITKSNPGQQFLSLIRFRDYTYTFTPIDHSVMIFFTRDVPKSAIYSWDGEKDEFIPTQRADRSRVNLLVQEVIDDTMITSIFYNREKKSN
jgi:hypothetical protein